MVRPLRGRPKENIPLLSKSPDEPIRQPNGLQVAGLYRASPYMMNFNSPNREQCSMYAGEAHDAEGGAETERVWNSGIHLCLRECHQRAVIR